MKGESNDEGHDRAGNSKAGTGDAVMNKVFQTCISPEGTVDDDFVKWIAAPGTDLAEIEVVWPWPFNVLCPTHGQMPLSDEEYRRQLFLPNARWQCPKCGEESGWDDKAYDRATDLNKYLHWNASTTYQIGTVVIFCGVQCRVVSDSVGVPPEVIEP